MIIAVAVAVVVFLRVKLPPITSSRGALIRDLYFYDGTENRPHSIYQYSNTAPRLSGQNCKIFKFFGHSLPKRDLDTKKTTPNIEVCPESLGAMLEY